MPQRILNKRDVPRGNYDFTVKQTGQKIDAHVFDLLVRRVDEHMTANNVEVPANLYSVIEADFCTRNPQYCRGTDKTYGGEELLTKVAATLAVPAADVLAGLSKIFGIHCKACSYRHRIIRQMKKLGLQETLRQLKETI